MLNKLLSHPVRLYLHSLLVPLSAILVTRGIITQNDVPLYIGLATALLGIPAVEVAERKTVARKDLDGPNGVQ